MTTPHSLARPLVTLAALALLAACDDAATTASGGAGGAAASSGATTASATTTKASSNASSSGDGSSADASSSSSGGPIMACADIGATDCFSNYDCPDLATRCENQTTAGDEIPCCVPGARGAGEAGDPCTGENDCKSSLCIDDGGSAEFCTDVCSSLAECPMPPFESCAPIAFSGSNDDFCLP